MDASTSALDNTTQREALKAVREMAGNRTIIMIAHRLSTIANTDAIFFVDKGRMLAHGTHEALIKTCGEHRELYQAEQTETTHQRQTAARRRENARGAPRALPGRANRGDAC